MYVLENTEPSFWREKQIEDCFYCLFDHVIQAVKSKQCPHFWLTGINFFEELTDREVKRLLKLLMKIRRDPSPYIDDSLVKTLVETKMKGQKMNKISTSELPWKL